MTTFAICITVAIASICNLAAVLVWAAFKSAKSEPEPSIDDLALKWAQIAEDFAPEEFELLRRIDRQMAGAEDRVTREWQDMPYDHEREGL